MKAILLYSASTVSIPEGNMSFRQSAQPEVPPPLSDWSSTSVLHGKDCMVISYIQV